MKKKINKLKLVSVTFGLLVLLISCGEASSQTNNDYVKVIDGVEHLEKVINEAGDTLLMFDLYADWCGPCRMLAPILEQVAEERQKAVVVYKVDTEKYPEIASMFGVRGIPHVAFIKNKKAVEVLTGLRAKEAYFTVIDKFKASK